MVESVTTGFMWRARFRWFRVHVVVAGYCGLLIWLAAGVEVPRLEAAGVREPVYRHLFVVDTSFSMGSRAEKVRESVYELLRSGCQGQMHNGEPFGIWTFDDQMDTAAFIRLHWDAQLNQLFANKAYQFLSHLEYRRQTRLDRAMVQLLALVRDADRLTVYLYTDGDAAVTGTPFDEQINSDFQQRRRELRRSRIPFVTILRSRGGEIVQASVQSAEKLVVPAPETAGDDPLIAHRAPEAPVPAAASPALKATPAEAPLETPKVALAAARVEPPAAVLRAPPVVENRSPAGVQSSETRKSIPAPEPPVTSPARPPLLVVTEAASRAPPPPNSVVAPSPVAPAASAPPAVTVVIAEPKPASGVQPVPERGPDNPVQSPGAQPAAVVVETRQASGQEPIVQVQPKPASAPNAAESRVGLGTGRGPLQSQRVGTAPPPSGDAALRDSSPVAASSRPSPQPPVEVNTNSNLDAPVGSTAVGSAAMAETVVAAPSEGGRGRVPLSGLVAEPTAGGAMFLVGGGLFMGVACLLGVLWYRGVKASRRRSSLISRSMDRADV